METAANIAALWPRWMNSAGEILCMNAQVRTRCCQCSTLMRADLADIVARHGAGYSLVDRLRMVECHGSTFYLVARTYGREWRSLLRDPELLAAFEDLPPA